MRKFKTGNLAIIISLLLFLTSGVFAFFVLMPAKYLITSPRAKSENAPINSEIKINFLGPVQRNFLVPSITPEISGEWQYRNPLITKDSNGQPKLFRTLVFIPDQFFVPDKEYRVKLSNIRGFVNKRSSSFNFGFRTQKLPRVLETKVISDREIKIKLSSPNPGLVKFSFGLEPETEYTTKVNRKKDEYILTAKESFLKNTQYNIKIEGIFYIRDKKTKEIVFQEEAGDIYSSNFEIPSSVILNQDNSKTQVSEELSKIVRFGPFVLDRNILKAQADGELPKIVSFGPKGIRVFLNKKIRIDFSKPMQRESVENNFSVSPTTGGTFSWSEDNKTLIFTPSRRLQMGTNFKVILKKEALDVEGKSFSEDFIFYFKTIGRVKISFYPKKGATGIGRRSGIKIYFNQPINKTSAVKHFRIYPKIRGNLKFSSDSKKGIYFMTFIPKKGFSYQKKYKVRILPRVKSLYNTYSTVTHYTFFSTQNKTKILNVHLDFQDYPLSCEAAALKMALNYKKKYVSEKRILKYIKFDNSYRRGRVWGDAYSVFVGSLMGRQNTTGYGVYWKPIGKAAKVWRPKSKAFSNWKISDLTKEVNKGNPVVVWGVCGRSPRRDAWLTRNGKYIPAWKGEHARVVIGFVGPLKNPKKIILNDPYFGKLYWTTGEFLNNWKKFKNSGVVIR